VYEVFLYPVFMGALFQLKYRLTIKIKTVLYVSASGNEFEILTSNRECGV